jgi:glycerol-3-phosphate dehydrogenase (NAD(P)+)
MVQFVGKDGMNNHLSKSSEDILVVGAGAYGCALALCALEIQKRVTLVSRKREHFDLHKKENPKLSHARFVEMDTFHEDLSQYGLIILTIPCQALRSVASWMKQCLLKHYKDEADFPSLPIITASKGIEEETLLLPHEILKETLGPKVCLASLSGPSFAKEILQKKPTSVVVASTEPELIKRAVSSLHSSYLRIYDSTDIIGVEIGGALKNVVAVAAGISDGLNFGYNTRAAIITRGLEETATIGCKLGANPLTFLGLSGLGDTCLTCTSDLSRNRQLGMRLAKGETLQDIRSSIDSTIESIATVHSAYLLAQKLKVETPLIDTIYDVVHLGVPVEAAFNSFINRPQTSELKAL